MECPDTSMLIDSIAGLVTALSTLLAASLAVYIQFTVKRHQEILDERQELLDENQRIMNEWGSGIPLLDRDLWKKYWELRGEKGRKEASRLAQNLPLD